jgi:hypothetical protein
MAYFRGYVAGIKRNQRSVKVGDDLPNVQSPKIGYDLDKIATDIAEGWGPFTDLLETRGELGIEPEKLMKSWLEPMWPEIEKRVGISDYPVVNEKRVEEYASGLRRLWRKLTT